VLRSPELWTVSSPFAAHKCEPFHDDASCRSRLSDYGYDTFSEDEDEGEDEQAHEADAAACKRATDYEDCGFWAEVGASGKQSGRLCAMRTYRTCFPISK
jgi:hypothetical protein